MTNYLLWNKRVFDTLFDIAQQVAPVRSARIAAAVVCRNQIMSIGTNKYKTDPLQARYSRKGQIYVHAEVDAIKNVRYRIDLSKCDLYVARAKLTECGQWAVGNCRPCPGCQKIIEMYGIQNVYHT